MPWTYIDNTVLGMKIATRKEGDVWTEDKVHYTAEEVKRLPFMDKRVHAVKKVFQGEVVGGGKR